MNWGQDLSHTGSEMQYERNELLNMSPLKLKQSYYSVVVRMLPPSSQNVVTNGMDCEYVATRYVSRYRVDDILCIAI